MQQRPKRTNTLKDIKQSNSLPPVGTLTPNSSTPKKRYIIQSSNRNAIPPVPPAGLLRFNTEVNNIFSSNSTKALELRSLEPIGSASME